jgi:tripartite-type tricarboxylate transporter receptor subunit TctC
MIVAVAAGGAPDLAARTLAARLQKPLGQPVIVENRGGANGNLAGQAVSQSPPDGYTLLMAPDSVVVINPHIYREKMPFDAKALVPVAHVIRNQFVLAVHPSVPAKTLKEFVEYARQARKPVAYASAGNGSQHHLLMELLKARAGIDMLHVPYRGGAPAVAATVAADTLATIAGGPSTAPHVRAGALRLLAGTAAKRWELMPDLPVIGELYPGYEGTVWSAVFAPAGTPPAIVARLHKDINAVLAENEVREVFGKSGGALPYISTPAELAEVIRRDTEKYAKVVSDIKLTAEE